jgi:hypothetical protein
MRGTIEPAIAHGPKGMTPKQNPAGKVRHVLLFSGHMIDGATRATPRFPPQAEPAAARAIRGALASLKVGRDDLGLTEGACGGDLIFAEALLARGASLELRLPFHESIFRKNSVTFRKQRPPSDRWLERFIAVRDHPRVHVRVMHGSDAPLPRHQDPYERCNLWMLRDALAFGGDRVRFVCLWDGKQGDGRGGTAHMMQCVASAGGKSVWIDARRLREAPSR